MITEQVMKNKVGKIDDKKLYSVAEVKDMELIVNTKLQPSVFTIYRLIASGALKSVNLGAGTKSRSFIRGKDIKDFVKKRYSI